MDIQERYFVAIAATICFVLIGIGFLALLVPSGSRPEKAARQPRPCVFLSRAAREQAHRRAVWVRRFDFEPGGHGHEPLSGPPNQPSNEPIPSQRFTPSARQLPRHLERTMTRGRGGSRHALVRTAPSKGDAAGPPTLGLSPGWA